MSNRLKLRATAERRSETVDIQLDGQVRKQIEAVEDALDHIDRASASNDRRLGSKGDDAERDQLVAELDALYESAEQSTFYVTLQALQRTPYRALVDAYPPRRGEDGKVLQADLFGANMEAFQIPLIRACMVGYKDSGDVADTDVKPFPPDLVDGKPNTEDVTVGWLLGLTYKDPNTGEDVTVEPFLTDRQVEKLFNVAIVLNRGDDAVPLRRRRSATPMSDAE